MSTTPNLLIDLLTESQNHKEVTVNSALVDFDGTLTGLFTQAMGDADQTLSNANGLYNMVFACTGALTGDRRLIVPPHKKLYVVNNQTTGGHNIVVATSAGSPAPIEVLVPPVVAEYVWIYCDGVDVVAIGASSAPFVGDSGSGGVAGLVPAPPAGSTAAGKFLKADGTFAVPAGSGSVTVFTDLSDVPASYSGAGGQAVEVNAGATALVFKPKPFDPYIFNPGVGSNAQTLLYVKLTRAVTFPASAPNSFAVAKTAATASTTFTFKKNGSSFATVNFAISGTTGAWTQASDATFAAGDILEIDGPATADATLADFGISLFGVRS